MRYTIGFGLSLFPVAVLGLACFLLVDLCTRKSYVNELLLASGVLVFVACVFTAKDFYSIPGFGYESPRLVLGAMGAGLIAIVGGRVLVNKRIERFAEFAGGLTEGVFFAHFPVKCCMDRVIHIPDRVEDTMVVFIVSAILTWCISKSAWLRKVAL